MDNCRYLLLSKIFSYPIFLRIKVNKLLFILWRLNIFRRISIKYVLTSNLRVKSLKGILSILLVVTRVYWDDHVQTDQNHNPHYGSRIKITSNLQNSPILLS